MNIGKKANRLRGRPFEYREKKGEDSMRAIFMGTPEFAVASLETLMQSEFEICLVITQPDRRKDRGKKMQAPAVKLKAEEYGMEVYQPQRIRDREAVEKIKALSPDLIVVTAYGQILPKEILEIPRLGCVNVHASLLPKYRGAAPINRVLIDGEAKTGITTMYMEEGLDTGDMIFQDEIEIGDDRDAQQLHDALAELSKETLSRTLLALVSGTAPRTPQDEAASSYAKIMEKSLGEIRWELEAKKICDLIRGVFPWPGAYTSYRGQRMKIIRAKCLEEEAKSVPGKILRVSEEGIDTAAADHPVRITHIQMPGKKAMSVSDYLKGNSIEVGEILSLEDRKE